MAEIEFIEPVVRICAVISRHDDARDWGIQTLQDAWGAIAHQTAPLPFPAGGFYDSEMGPGLQKVIVAFQALCDCGELADWKLATNEWEKQFARDSDHTEPRPLNLDCGYVTQAKLVLATTKDRDHRLYLRDGIFAEVTLNYVAKKWIHHRWSYPDYRTESVAEFATKSRNQVRAEVQRLGQIRIRQRSGGS